MADEPEVDGQEVDGSEEGGTPTSEELTSSFQEMMMGLEGSPKGIAGDEPEEKEGDEKDPEKDEVIEDKPEVKDDVKKEEGDDKPAAKEPEKKEDDKPEEKKEEELSDLDKMRVSLNEMASLKLAEIGLSPDALIAPKPAVPAPVAEKVEEKVPEIKKEEPITVELKDDEFEGIAEDKEKFITILNKMATAIKSETKKAVMLDINPLVLTTVQNIVTNLEAVREFYDSNPDLKKQKAIVGLIANKVQQKNPDWDRGQVLTATEKEARQVLHLAKKAIAKEENGTPQPPQKKGRKKPAFAGGTGGRQRSKEEPGSKEGKTMKSEMDAMRRPTD